MTKPKYVSYKLIDPAKKRVMAARFKTLQEAEIAAGLTPHEVDFGSLDGTHSIVVYEYGLFAPTNQTSYFAIGKRLYAGNAVIFAERWDKQVDVEIEPEIRWFDNAQEVEQAIEMGDIDQPVMKIGNEVIWVWPQPKPTSFGEKEKSK